MITQEEVKQIFNYDPNTGKLTWKSTKSNRIKIGSEVCHKNPYGYLQVRLKKKLWMIHRIIWLWMYGCFPNGEIDHINGVRDDNRISNLRDVTKFTNMQNRKKADKDSLTGLLGVTFDKQSGKYKAQMIVNKVRVLNKLFRTPEEASAAYWAAKEIYHHFRSRPA